MAALAYQQLLSEAEQLSREEKLLLIERLAEQLRTTEPTAADRPRWEDYAGTAPYPLCGEDAQAWVSRTRAESDLGREIP